MISHYLLELDGKPAGTIFEVKSGGFALKPWPGGQAPVITNEHFTFQCGVGMSSAFYHWLGSGVKCRPVPKAVSVVGLNREKLEEWRVEYHNALISGFAFPPLSDDWGGEAYLTVKVRAPAAKSTSTGYKRRKHHRVGERPLLGISGRKFGFSITGLKGLTPCRIDGMSLGINKAELSFGSEGNYQIAPLSRGYPPLVVTEVETLTGIHSHAAVFSSVGGPKEVRACSGDLVRWWYDPAFLISGEEGPKTATLEYRGHHKEPFFRVEFCNLQRMGWMATTNWHNRKAHEASMLCDDMRFKAEPAACIG